MPFVASASGADARVRWCSCARRNTLYKKDRTTEKIFHVHRGLETDKNAIISPAFHQGHRRTGLGLVPLCRFRVTSLSAFSSRDACPGRVSAWGALPDRFRVSELGLPRCVGFVVSCHISNHTHTARQNRPWRWRRAVRQARFLHSQRFLRERRLLVAVKKLWAG